MANLIAPLNDPDTLSCVSMERAFLGRLDGSCRTPIAGLARLEEGAISFRGMILSPDGSEAHETSRKGPVENAEQLAIDAADELLDQVGADFLASSS
jgi:hydroxymethylbilane synthase